MSFKKAQFESESLKKQLASKARVFSKKQIASKCEFFKKQITSKARIFKNMPYFLGKPEKTGLSLCNNALGENLRNAVNGAVENSK